MNIERPDITIVTRNGSNKDAIFQAALPGWHIDRKEPGFDETRIQRMAPHTEIRPVFIAEEKAREDAAWVSAICGTAEAYTAGARVIPDGKDRIYLYTDSVQFVHEDDGSLTILEKPHQDPDTWASQSAEAMAQSDKDVEIVNALTAVRCGKDGVSEPKTVILRVHAHMRPYTRDEVVAYAKGSGRKSVENDAGGISLANGGRHFYDTDRPLVVSVQDSIEGNESELFRFDSWALVPDRVLRPFICGAIEPAVVRLVQKTQVSS